RPSNPNLLYTDLFRYDGTDTPKYYTPVAAGTYGLSPGPFIVCNNKLYFGGSTNSLGGGTELHELDPATDSIRLPEALPGTTDKVYSFYSPVVTGNKLYFTAYHRVNSQTVFNSTEGCELHCWDGNTIRQLTAMGPGLDPGIMAEIGTYQGSVYFGGLDTATTY